ncbi:MAG: nitrilase-related carbon-nitrogen hydrolase [Planctomycetota bacterium]
MRISAFQFSPVPGGVPENLARAAGAVEKAAAAGAKLIALPELWATSFAFGNVSIAIEASQNAIVKLQELSARLDICIVGSVLSKSPSSKPYNSSIVMDRGKVVETYHKTHLFTPTREDAVFERGSSFPRVVETCAGRAGTVICYDLRFPELCRSLFVNGAEIVIVPAQWASERAEQFRTLLMARAVENQSVYIGVNRTGSESSISGTNINFPGRSIIINALGEIEAEATDAEQLIFADIDFRRQAAFRRLIPCAADRRLDLYKTAGTSELGPELLS